MDISTKIPKEDLLKINELKLELMKRDISVNQKELVDMAIKFSLKRKKDYINELIRNKKGFKMKNTKEMVEEFLDLPKVDFGKDWMKEIDIIEGYLKKKR